MANFADTRERRYNDYVGLPVDAYAQIGMYKQGMYEQGIQQIQTALSTVAGLEVARDVDKQYLESKVNEVTSKINSIAGGDWSNKNLVSKATGIASSVAKDTYVQDAIYSTAAIKQFAASQKALKEKNPELYPVSAEWYDSQELQRYMSSNEVGDKYKGPKEATRHFGKQRDEEIRKALKELSPTVTPVVTNDGYTTYIDTMSIVPASKIQEVVHSILASNPEYQKAFQIDSAFIYKDFNRNELYQETVGKTDNTIGELANANSNLLKKMKEDPTNLEKMNLYKKEIEYNNSKILETQSMKDQFQTYFNQNADINQIKNTLYSANYVNQFVSNYQKEAHQLDIKENYNVTKAQDFQIANEKLKLDKIKTGIDPDTNQPIDSSSKYYPLWVTSSNSKTTPSTLSTTTVSSSTSKTTQDSVNESLITLNEEKKIIENRYLNDFINIHGGTYDDAQAWLNTQKAIFEKGETPDALYIQMNKEKEKVSLKEDALRRAQQKIETDSYLETENRDRFNKIPFTDFSVNPKENKDFVGVLNKLEQDVIQRLNAKKIEVNDATMNMEARAVISNYSNNAFYKQLKQVVENEFTTGKRILLQEPSAVVKKKDEKYKEIGILKNAQGVRLEQDDASALSVATDAITSFYALSNSEIPADVAKAITDKKIVPTRVYYDPATDQPKIDVMIGNTASTFNIPGNTNLLPKKDAYSYISEAIEIAPDHKTAAMFTGNGKMQYKIGKQNNGSYYAQIYNNGTFIPLNGLTTNKAGDIAKAIESFSVDPRYADLSNNERTRLLILSINDPLQYKKEILKYSK